MHLLLFNKDRTDVIKGVAILMMIWLHSFTTSDYSQYNSLIWISGRPLASYIVDACNPVGLFMVLSGYGMYFSYLKAKKEGLHAIRWQHSVARLVRLYIPFWIATILAMVIMKNNVVLDKFSDIAADIANLTAYNPTFNIVGWYIAPFVLTSLFIDRIFRWFEKYEIAFLLIGLLYYYGMAHVYGLAYDRIAEIQWLLVFCRTSEFFFPMLLGASAAKHATMEFKVINNATVSVISFVIVVMMFAYSSWRGIPAYPIYCALLVLLIANIRFTHASGKCFAFLGKHSMNIWFVHAFFIGLARKAQYPVLIIIVLTVISILMSYIIDFISKPIVKGLTSKLQ